MGFFPGRNEIFKVEKCFPISRNFQQNRKNTKNKIINLLFLIQKLCKFINLKSRSQALRKTKPFATSLNRGSLRTPSQPGTRETEHHTPNIGKSYEFYTEPPFTRPRGVTASTLDSESSDCGSNPREALGLCFR